MQEHHNTGAGRRASAPAKISRRFLMKGFAGAAAVGAVVGIASPAVAKSSTVMTDEDQLTACIEQMKAILSRMHPETISFRSEYIDRLGGIVTIIAEGDVPEVKWSGPGVYLIRHMTGDKTYWIEKADPKFGFKGYSAALWWDGYKLGPRIAIAENDLNIIRKIPAMPRVRT